MSSESLYVMTLNANFKSSAVMFITENIITGPPTHSVGASIVLLSGVWRRRL